MLALGSVRRLANLSFRWQILFLGALVVILSVSVLFAIFATLHYTKSAVLKQQRDYVLQTARELAQEYEDRADLDRRNGHPVLLGVPDSPSSGEVLSLLGRVVLKDSESTAGGFYNVSTDSLIGEFSSEGGRIFSNPGIGGESGTHSEILSAARSAASSHAPTEKVFFNSPGIVLIEAVPVHDGYSVVGSAWSIRHLADLPGANRFRAFLISSALGLAALASVLLTLFVINGLQGGVRKIEGSLKTLENNLATEIETAGEPREIQEIVRAINRLGGALREKIEREKQFENRLRHSERLASLGRLVAGVAHEVRNPLATIRLRVQMCSRESTNPRVRESCTVALLEIERLNEMVNRLLNFTRPVQLHLTAVDLRSLIQERIESFRDLSAHCRVGIASDVSSSLPTLHLDRNRMAQVFDNIIQNAIEAMADSGGTLFVSATTHIVNGNEPTRVSVEFRDTGKGMSPSILSRAFDPFFTTKASGTGLGLSICHELMSAHGGEIHAKSESDRGTSVRVTIPVTPNVQAHEHVRADRHEY
jgi:signal transduction histidine kinase